MIGLSKDIEDSINIIIEGLGYDTIISDIDPSKMKASMDAKKDSFIEAKTLLNEWVNSPNKPSERKIELYAKKLVSAGDASIIKLRKALKAKIDYENIPPEKHGAAIKAKTIILKTIRLIDSALIELRVQILSKNIKFSNENFKLGWAERFANGDFYPESDYHNSWYDKNKDAVIICPKGTKGELITIEDLNIILPKVPAKKYIKYSNLPKKEQYWRREQIPKGLNPTSTDSFTSYILEQFRLRREGMWFMNFGEPIYLPGSFWFALQWGKMLDTGGYMDFRYAQLRINYHQEACQYDKRCLGQLFVKSRRTGATYLILLSRLLEESTRKKNGRYGMTSKGGTDAQEAFKKYAYAFTELPFFFQPIVKGKTESEEKLYFGKPPDTTRAAKLAKDTSTNDYLNTEIDYRPTKNDSYDSMKLDGYLGDESGKWLKPSDFLEHFGTIKPTMMPGGRIIGKCWACSTVGAMKKGGENFRTLDEMSNVATRNAVTKNTLSGLYSMFLPAHKNQEICTDKYGKCWEQKPPPGTLDKFGIDISFGSVEYLIEKAKEAAKKGDKVLNSFYRAEPMSREHAYRDKSDECEFNINKLYEQIDYNNIKDKEELYTVGNFSWKDGIRDSEVVFTPNRSGRFKIAWMPSVVDDTDELLNNVKKSGEKVFPLNNFGYLSSDPFSVRSAANGRGSSGAIHGFCSEDVGMLKKNDCFLEYLCRAKTEDIFFEDVVMALHFYGIKILAELNRVDLLRYIRNRGYRPFSLERLDKTKSKLNPHEKEYGGQQLSGVSILSDHLSAINSYIDFFVGIASKNNPYRPEGEIGKFPFNETLNDWINFDPDKRTKHDASISSGLGIMAINKDKYKKKVKKKSKVFKISQILQVYSYGTDKGARV